MTHAATTPVAIEVRNLRSGQLIEMTVLGRWTETAVADRLQRIITAREPAEIRLLLPIEDATADLPSFEQAQELLADVGGTLLVEPAGVGGSDSDVVAGSPP